MEFSRRNEPIILINENVYYNIPEDLFSTEVFEFHSHKIIINNSFNNMIPVKTGINQLSKCRLSNYDVYMITDRRLSVVNMEDNQIINQDFNDKISDVTDDGSKIYILLDDGSQYIIDPITQQCEEFRAWPRLIINHHSIWEIHPEYVINIDSGKFYMEENVIDLAEHAGHVFISRDFDIKIYLNNVCIDNLLYYNEYDSLPIYNNMIITQTFDKEILLYDFVEKRRIEVLHYFNNPNIISYRNNKFFIKDDDIIYIISLI